MAFINDAIVFDNPAAITAMVATKLVDGMFYACSDTGDGYPGWYQYKAASGATLDSPNVIDCTNGTGRFVLFGGQSSGGGASNIEIIRDTQSPVDRGGEPTYDGTTGCSFYIQASNDYGSTTYNFYVGVDTTGNDEAYGWLKIQNY